MVEFISVIIFNVIWFGVIVSLQYYLQLFQGRDEFHRDELIGINRFIDFAKKLVFVGEKPFFDLMLLGLGMITGWLFSLFGFLSMSERSGSYLFHSPLLLLALVFGYNSIIILLEKRSNSSFLNYMAEYELSFLLGLAVSTVTMPIVMFINYAYKPATISFFWVFLNTVISVALIEFYLFRKLAKNAAADNDSQTADDQGDNSDSQGESETI